MKCRLDNTSVILIVDDSLADREIIKRTLQTGKIDCHICEVEDGEQAMDYLNGIDKYAERSTYPFPDLLLLDINMPKKDGKEILSVIRSNQQFKPLPVIMLTTSDSEKDVLDSYQLGVNAYITKPVDIKQFIESISLLKSFWFQLVKLPHLENHV